MSTSSPEDEYIDLSGPKPYKSTYTKYFKQLEQSDKMPRHSERFIWKEGDGEGKKGDSNPKLYNEPPHKIVEGDETTYPPRFVDLSSMWVFQVVRCPFITQTERYQRWPAVFPSKDPLRKGWVNKGLAPKMWSDVKLQWVYPVVFNKYQLHGEEGASSFDIDQSKYLQTVGWNTSHDILEGAECVVQEAPASSGGRSSGGLQAAVPSNKAVATDIPTDDSSSSSEEEAPAKRQKTDEEEKAPPARVQRGRKAKTPAVPKATPAPTPSAPKAAPTPSAPKATPAPTPSAPKAAPTKSRRGRKKSGTSTNLEPSPSSEVKTEPSPSTKIIDSATGGRRLYVSDSEEQDNDLQAAVAILRAENTQYEEQLAQAQGKVVILAEAVNGMWALLYQYGERMAEWNGLSRAWNKGADKESLDNLMDNLSDNKKVNDSLRKEANKIVDKVSAFFPALDRITLDTEAFAKWRDASPERFEKLFEKLDQKVDGKGNFGLHKLA